jgi:hypothetical protein
MTWVFIFQKRKEKNKHLKTYLFVQLFKQNEAKKIILKFL